MRVSLKAKPSLLIFTACSDEIRNKATAEQGLSQKFLEVLISQQLRFPNYELASMIATNQTTPAPRLYNPVSAYTYEI